MAFWTFIDYPTTLQSQVNGGGGFGSIASGEEIGMVSTVLPSGVQQVTVLDRTKSVLAVYHIDPVNGGIQLKSVRNIGWDLKMEEFNATAPLPSELRGLQP